MRIFLIGGSPEAQPPARLAPAPGELVIAADHGAAHARAWGWPLHLLVGDLDSLSADEAALVAAAGVPVITAPAAKDETDLELALGARPGPGCKRDHHLRGAGRTVGPHAGQRAAAGAAGARRSGRNSRRRSGVHPAAARRRFRSRRIWSCWGRRAICCPCSRLAATPSVSRPRGCSILCTTRPCSWVRPGASAMYSQAHARASPCAAACCW